MNIGRNGKSFLVGSTIGTLGGLIGLGGAEFRLPVLVGLFGFKTIEAVVVNLLVSLVTVAFSLLFRLHEIAFSELVGAGPIILNLLAGSLIGSLLGVRFATRIDETLFNRIVFIFLVGLAFLLIGHELLHAGTTPLFASGWLTTTAGFCAGIVIGIFSSMLGVAGGELLIPTILFLYAVDIKLAGSLSLAVSLPTILVGLYKYSQHATFESVRSHKKFIAAMAAGSILGAFIGSFFLGIAPAWFLKSILGVILLISAYKLFKKHV